MQLVKENTALTLAMTVISNILGIMIVSFLTLYCSKVISLLNINVLMGLTLIVQQRCFSISCTFCLLFMWKTFSCALFLIILCCMFCMVENGQFYIPHLHDFVFAVYDVTSLVMLSGWLDIWSSILGFVFDLSWKIKMRLVLSIIYFDGLIIVSSCYVHFVYLYLVCSTFCLSTIFMEVIFAIWWRISAKCRFSFYYSQWYS